MTPEQAMAVCRVTLLAKGRDIPEEELWSVFHIRYVRPEHHWNETVVRPRPTKPGFVATVSVPAAALDFFGWGSTPAEACEALVRGAMAGIDNALEEARKLESRAREIRQAVETLQSRIWK